MYLLWEKRLDRIFLRLPRVINESETLSENKIKGIGQAIVNVFEEMSKFCGLPKKNVMHTYLFLSLKFADNCNNNKCKNRLLL